MQQAGQALYGTPWPAGFYTRRCDMEAGQRQGESMHIMLQLTPCDTVNIVKLAADGDLIHFLRHL